MPVSDEEKKKSKKRLKRFTAQADSIKNDEGAYKRFLKYKKGGGKESMSTWLNNIDEDSVEANKSKKNERMRQNHYRQGRTAMDFAETKDDSTSVRKQRDAGLGEGEIANNIRENTAFRKAVKKMMEEKKSKKKKK